MGSHADAPAKKRIRTSTLNTSRMDDESTGPHDVSMVDPDDLHTGQTQQANPMEDNVSTEDDKTADDIYDENLDSDEAEPDVLPIRMRPMYHGKARGRFSKLVPRDETGELFYRHPGYPVVTRPRTTDETGDIVERHEIVLPYRDIHPAYQTRNEPKVPSYQGKGKEKMENSIETHWSNLAPTRPTFIGNDTFVFGMCCCSDDPEEKNEVESDPCPTLEALDSAVRIMGQVPHDPIYRYETEQVLVHEPGDEDHIWFLYRIRVMTDTIPCIERAYSDWSASIADAKRGLMNVAITFPGQRRKNVEKKVEETRERDAMRDERDEKDMQKVVMEEKLMLDALTEQASKTVSNRSAAKTEDDGQVTSMEDVQMQVKQPDQGGATQSSQLGTNQVQVTQGKQRQTSPIDLAQGLRPFTTPAFQRARPATRSRTRLAAVAAAAAASAPPSFASQQRLAGTRDAPPAQQTEPAAHAQSPKEPPSVIPNSASPTQQPLHPLVPLSPIQLLHRQQSERHTRALEQRQRAQLDDDRQPVFAGGVAAFREKCSICGGQRRPVGEVWRAAGTSVVVAVEYPGALGRGWILDPERGVVMGERPNY